MRAWVNALSDDALELNDAGAYLLERIAVAGTSYAPLCSRVHDLQFGESRYVWYRPKWPRDAPDRTLNVIASGFQHEIFSHVEGTIISLFDHDEKQPIALPIWAARRNSAQAHLPNRAH